MKRNASACCKEEAFFSQADDELGLLQYVLDIIVVVVVVSHIQCSGCQLEKATLHGGQSRSWSGGLEVVESAREVQQGRNLGPLCYSAGSLKILKYFRANPPVPGARAVSFIDDITIILPPELSLDMAAIEKVME